MITSSVDDVDWLEVVSGVAAKDEQIKKIADNKKARKIRIFDTKIMVVQILRHF